MGQPVHPFLPRTLLLCVLTLISALLLAGCPPKSPELAIAEQRARYTVQLNSFIPQEPEPSMDMMAEEATEAVAEAGEAAMAAESAMAAEGEAAAAEGEEGEEGEAGEEMEPEGPKSAQVLFDLLVNYDGRDDPLPGVTLDISHADPFEKEKGTYKHWIDTSAMSRGQLEQFDFTLEIPDFETGDVFSVYLRSNIPPGELGDYREFSAAP